MLSHHQYKTINYGTVNTSLQQHKLTQTPFSRHVIQFVCETIHSAVICMQEAFAFLE